MDKKYVNYLNDMLTHIRKGEELSKKSKEVGKKYGVAHDLIYYAQLTGHIKRVTKGKYVSTVSRFTIIDAEEIYESRCKKLQKLKKAKAKADKKQLSLFTPKNVIVEGGIYKHPQHGLVVVDEIMSDSIAYVLLLETTSLQIRRDVHSSKLVRAENEETKFE